MAGFIQDLLVRRLLSQEQLQRLVQPEKEREADWGSIGTALLAGIGAGASLMFLLDPAAGRRRRHLVRDQVSSVVHRGEETLGKSARDLAHRTRGLVAETRGALRQEEVPDDVLVERVRAAMGRATSHPHAIETEVKNGRVILRGPILADELDDVIGCVSQVRGVKGVDSLLEIHAGAGDVPGLQGRGHRIGGGRFELLQENWSPGPRLLAGLLGGSLLVLGMRKRGLIGNVLGLGGAGIIARATVNRPMKRIVGVRAGRRAVDFQKTIYINAPIEEVYTFWNDFRNFPRFMSHVKEIRVTGDNRSHWVVLGPAGISAEWDAVITRREPNRVIAWRSVPGSRIENAGIIQFESDPRGGTRVNIRLSYNPPAGSLGHLVAALFGKDPKHAMDDDLVRFKSLLEQGKATGRDGQVRREELEPASPPTTTPSA